MSSYSNFGHLYDPFKRQQLQQQQPARRPFQEIQNNALWERQNNRHSINLSIRNPPPRPQLDQRQFVQNPMPIFQQQQHNATNTQNNYLLHQQKTVNAFLPTGHMAPQNNHSIRLNPRFDPFAAPQQTFQSVIQQQPVVPQQLVAHQQSLLNESQPSNNAAPNNESTHSPSTDSPHVDCRVDTRPQSKKRLDNDELKLRLGEFFCLTSPRESLLSFCKERDLDRNTAYFQMYRCLNHGELKDLVRERGIEESVNRAITIINSLPGKDVTRGMFEAESIEKYFTPRGLREDANGLDFTQRPRVSRSGLEDIQVHKRKEMDERTRSLTLLLYNEVMSKSPKLSSAERKDVLKDAATIVMYDQGYEKVSGITKINKTWYRRLLAYFKTGDGRTPLKNKSKGRFSYRDKIEAEHPGYITELYRKAEQRMGWQGSFPAMAAKINMISRTPPYDNKPDLMLTGAHLRRHFRLLGGKLKSPVEKPYKTADQQKETLDWAITMKERRRQKGRNFHVCFLDEKWFYTTSRRRKIKVLPQQDGEDPANVPTYRRTCISRRFSTKVCMEVDCCFFLEADCYLYPMSFLLFPRLWHLESVLHHVTPMAMTAPSSSSVSPSPRNSCLARLSLAQRLAPA